MLEPYFVQKALLHSTELGILASVTTEWKQSSIYLDKQNVLILDSWNNVGIPETFDAFIGERE